MRTLPRTYPRTLARVLSRTVGEGGTRPAFFKDFISGDLPGNFTRASVAPYYDSNGDLQEAAIDEPRLDHYPGTGVPRGLLIQPADAPRAIDIATETDLSWLNPDEGTFLVTVELNDATELDTGVPCLLDVDDSGAVPLDLLRIGGDLNNTVQLAVLVGGTTTANISAPVTGYSQGDTLTAAGAYKLNDMQIAANGALSPGDTSAAVPVGLARLTYGLRFDETESLGGWIKSVAYYDFRLTDAELQFATGGGGVASFDGGFDEGF